MYSFLIMTCRWSEQAPSTMLNVAWARVDSLEGLGAGVPRFNVIGMLYTPSHQMQC